MKKTLTIVFSACLLLAVATLAAGGGAEDPLISLSHLTDTFRKTLEQAVDQRLDVSDKTLLQNAENGAKTASLALTWEEIRLKQNDVLLGSTGTNVLLLAGKAQVQYDTGTVVDITVGQTISSGSALLINHRYMVAEDTSARFFITSRTAVLDYQGAYEFSLSEAVDYNSMATGLKSLNLFRGSFTGYGQGFDLEVAPTRLQALIMFIRVLGEEDQALSWSGISPFADIAKGSQAEQYVGYAYEKGYTNGYSATTFKPGIPVNAGQYTEFVLRAMGYSSAANTDLSDTLLRAQDAGVLTERTCELLRTEKFLRADLVYVSCRALEATMPDGRGTLADRLMDKGVFSKDAWLEASSKMDSSRL